MRVYLGVAVKEDYEILTRLHKLRDDIGICVSAYYYKTKLATRKNVELLAKEEIPVFLDNGAVQVARRKVARLSPDYLRSVCKKVNPDFLLAPDVLGNSTETMEMQLDFIKDNDDLELLAPLQSHNKGPIFTNEIVEDIDILKEAGYQRFGFGKPHVGMRPMMTRAETLMQFGIRLKPHCDYLHFLGYPLGASVGGSNYLDSADVGTFFLLAKYRYQAYKNPEESASILNSLIDIEQTMRGIREKQAQAKGVETK